MVRSLCTLRMGADGDGHAEEETLTCTGEHSFWVEDGVDNLKSRRFGVLAIVWQQLGRLDRD